MTIHDRILAAMQWEEPDQIPLTTFDVLLPRSAAARQLRNLGVGLVLRQRASSVAHREVEIISREYWEGDIRFVRKTIHTPVGDIWQTLEPNSGGFESTPAPTLKYQRH